MGNLTHNRCRAFTRLQRSTHIKQIKIVFTGSQSDAAKDLLIRRLVLRRLKAQWAMSQSWGSP